MMRVHRDPFEPIMCVLEADSRLAEYRKITDEIVRRMRMRTDIHDQPPKSLDHSYCFGWACTLGLGKRTFANFVSAPVDTIRRQNAGWRV